uniref:Uncharacterized protein n=1 Tax=Trypanosoma vivax (strain Y486) TaxID=1055687 RepID=G0TSG0_TRYVY|nr:hypothetical protein, unlikely [Trypanosoma vivax Y486]
MKPLNDSRCNNNGNTGGVRRVHTHGEGQARKQQLIYERAVINQKDGDYMPRGSAPLTHTPPLAFAHTRRRPPTTMQDFGSLCAFNNEERKNKTIINEGDERKKERKMLLLLLLWWWWWW